MDFNHDDVTNFSKGLLDLNISRYITESVLYKYTSIESAIKILEGGDLLYQNPSMFNDPFELHNGLLDARLATEDTFWRNVHENSNPEEIEIQKSCMTNEKFEEMVDRILNDTKRFKGILCLSKTMKNTLMWSHYSDKHSGVCLGFKMPSEIKDFPIVAFDVNYTDKITPRVFNMSESVDDLLSVVYWICTKSKVWEYEQEVRFINMNAFGVFPFQKHELCEIYFGAATSLLNIRKVNDVVKDKGYNLVKTGKMKINKNHFNLETIY